MIKQSGRIEWIDIAKGISIILVVCGHTRLSTVPYIGDWLGAFRMPFFFFISGLLFNPAKNTDFGLFLKKKWKGLGRPFVIFSFVVLLGYACVGQERLYGILYDFPHYGWLGHALWFIPVLFVTNLLYFLVCRYIQSDIARASALLILAIAGFLTDRLDVPNYWNLNFSLTAVLFYGFGNLSAPFLNRLFAQSSKIIMSFALIAALVSFCFVFNVKPEFYVNSLGRGGYASRRYSRSSYDV